METGKKTKSGVLVWTPAPVRTSPTTSVLSEDVWADEDEEEAEKDDDFFSQMDENGIIGLSEALEGVELEGSCWDSDAECNPNLYSGPLTLEEADTSGHERDTPKEQDLQRLSPFEEEQRNECMTEWDKYLDMTEEENDGDEAVTRSDRKRKKNKPTCTSRESRTLSGLAESNISKEEIDECSSPRSCSAHLLATEPSRVSNHHYRISQPASPIIAVTFPHLLHLTAEEIAAAPGIDAETLPAISFTESLPESHGSVKSSPRCPVVKLRASHPPAAMFNEVLSNDYSGVNNGPVKASDNSDKPRKQPTPSPRKMRQPLPEATSSRTRSPSMGKADSLKFTHQTSSPGTEPRTPKTTSNAAEVDESRKGPLSYRTPDFSNVEPRVHFPKGGYKPPKSRHFSKRTSLSPEPPFVFKSPADIVKEVLLNDTDGSAASSDSYKPPTSAPNSTVPQEFRSRQQATTLLDQLQEDYNRLLTKYADAENTIDRLRLEAKVNLYSDPPKPGHLVQSGLNQDTSKFMMLDFPQAQRAALNSASLHPNEHSTHQRSASACSSTRSPDPQMGQQLVKILYNQADTFLQQLQTFEDLLKSKKLRPWEQIKGLSQLTEGLGSLERGYLLARNEHKLLQQRGAEMCHFDAERELEGLIFQCGLLLDELKEQVDQGPDQPYSEAPLSSPPHPTPSPVPFEFGESEAHPQSPPVALLVDPGENAVVTATEESDEEEDTFNSHYLKPLNGKQRHVEQEFSTLMDPYQSFKELPKLLDHSQREGAPALRSDLQPGDEEKERPGHGTGNLAVQESLLQRNNISDQDSPPVGAGKQRASRSSSPSRRASSQSAMLPVLPPSSRRRLEVGKSHSSSLSSLGEITALERSISKLQTGRSRVPSQDGIISPETDSGFVCSESSHLTPAAAPSPPHQRAPESVSLPQEGNPKKTQIGPGSAASPAPSPAHSHTAMHPRRGPRLSHDRPSRTRQGQRRRAFSSSPECVVRQTEQTRVDSGTSEFGLESDTSHAVSEDRRNNQYTESNSLHHSSPGSSPAAQRHHGDSLRMLSSSRVANRNDAIQTLQAEVTRLRERLESCLRNTTPMSSVRAAPSAQENYTHHNTSTPRIRSGERWGDVSRGGRDRRTVDEVEESTPGRITRERAPSATRPQPDDCSEPSSPQPRPLVSRCTQTSASAPDSCRSQTNTVRSRTHPRQHPAVSGQASETADEPDSRGRQAPLCPQCLSRHQGQPETGGDRELTHSCCHRCPLCRYTEPSRSAESDCRRFFDSPSHTSCRPAVSPDRALRSGYFAAAAPPELLQCMPVCPPPLLLYSAPLYVSPSNSTSRASGGKGRRESRGRTRCFLSTDKQHTMDTSLSRAIRAARHMKHTSGHMARSLATGLHYQELLTQSCSH